MTQEERAALRSAMEECPQSEWRKSGYVRSVVTSGPEGAEIGVAQMLQANATGDKIARHIATFDPPTARRLLDGLDAGDRKISQLEKENGQLRMMLRSMVNMAGRIDQESRHHLMHQGVRIMARGVLREMETLCGHALKVLLGESVSAKDVAPVLAGHRNLYRIDDNGAWYWVIAITPTEALELVMSQDDRDDDEGDEPPYVDLLCSEGNLGLVAFCLDGEDLKITMWQSYLIARDFGSGVLACSEWP